MLASDASRTNGTLGHGEYTYRGFKRRNRRAWAGPLSLPENVSRRLRLLAVDWQLGYQRNLEILRTVSRKNLRLYPDERGCPNQASRRERMSMPRSERRANGADCELVHIRNSWVVGRAHPAAGPLAAASGGATPPARHSLGRKCWPFTQLALSPDSQFAVLRAPVPT